MGRRIYIIPMSMNVEDAIEDARANNCPEIVRGIPPALDGVIDEASLPISFEEPDLAPEEPPRSLHISRLESVDPGKVRPARVRRTWQGTDYYYDCFVVESIKDLWQAGSILHGDYVMVHFDDGGEQIITAKVYQSWDTEGGM